MKNFVLNIDMDNEKYLRFCETVEMNEGYGVRYRFLCENGIEASVVKFPGTYGYRDDLWEMAILFEEDLLYINEFKDGPIGYMDDKEVNEMLRTIRGRNYEAYDISS